MNRFVALCSLLILSCGGTTNVDTRKPAPQLFSPSSSVKKVVVEVDYGPNAKPYEGGALFNANAERLFRDSGKTLTLQEPTAIDEPTKDPVDVDELLAIASRHRDVSNTDDTASFYVLFVSAKFIDDTKDVRDDVLGVSIGNTGVIAMFKPVIESTKSILAPNLERFVEQTTLTHEFGHAIGLVNNGAPPIANHHDSAHGAHCSNTECVMYWQNEGASAAIEFARKYLTTGNAIVFDADCLADVDALKK
ncbi:MAG: hypothetical protein ACO1OB_16780 [Archangium sp.]